MNTYRRPMPRKFAWMICVAMLTGIFLLLDIEWQGANGTGCDDKFSVTEGR
jgi:hypothetical protein